MHTPTRDPGNVALALHFLRDRVGMTEEAMASAIGAADDRIADAMKMVKVAWSETQGRAVDAIVATQSLLLDGYTPDSASLWFTSPSSDLEGRVPISEMTNPQGTGRVLAAAASRMSR